MTDQTLTLCEAARPGYRSGERVWDLFCAAPAVAVHQYWCACGHQSQRRTCAAHTPEPGAVGCRACLEAGHDCEASARLVEDLT